MNFILALLSGILLPLALPNDYFLYGNPWIGIFAFTPFFIALYRSNTIKEAVALSALFGGVCKFLSNYWLMFYKDFALLASGSVTLAYIGVFALWGGLFWQFSRQGFYRPLKIAAIWTLFEFFKSIGYLGYPWGLSIYPFNQILPLLQIADIGGIWPLSFLVALGNAWLAEMILRTNLRVVYGALVSSITIVFFGYGFFRMSTPIPEKTTLRVVLVQHNMDPWIVDNEIENLQTLMDLSRRGIEKLDNKVDLVVWSESSLTRPISEHRSFFRQNPRGESFLEFLQNENTMFLIGNPVVEQGPEGREVQNGAILINPQGNILETYGKRHPVPIAEYIPFFEIPFVRDFFRNVIGIAGIWSLGDRDTIFTIPTHRGETIRFGVPICFEDAFPYICRRFILSGADLLINITNDSWSRRKSAMTQHSVVAMFRAIEMKRILIRATNGGLTSVIGPFGEKIATLPMFEEGYLSLEVPIVKESTLTFYTQWGDWFPLLLAIALIGILVRRVF